MAKLEILHYPDPRLRTRARPVEHVDAGIRTLVGSMFETMYAAPGIGLAATQVNVHLRVIVIDVSADRSEPVCLINPEIRSLAGSCTTDEGCLSVPDVFEAVRRAETVEVQALDEHGVSRVIQASGLLAVCIQHEMDHLEGRLFVDRLSELKRGRIRKKFDKAHRRAG